MDRTNFSTGEFPYPLTFGPDESRYLTWLRNHSNYMAQRGFLDYMRIVAVLVRGILINFLVLLPLILIAAAVLAQIYGGALRSLLRTLPTDASWGTVIGEWTNEVFILTPWVAGFALLYYFAFPMVIRLFKVIAQQQVLQTGAESSVKLRDKYERSFGGLLLAVVAVALVEALPLLIHSFHGLGELGFRGAAATVAGGSSVLGLSGAGKLLDMLDEGKRAKVKQALARTAIGLLGLLLPLLVVFYVTEYLVYQPFRMPWQVLEILPLTLALGTVVALVLGKVKKTLVQSGWLWQMLAGVLAVMAIIYYAWTAVQGALSGEQMAVLFVFVFAGEIWLFCRLAVDVNLTSVHGLYRDRLASAYLVGEDTKGDVDIEEDLDLNEICDHDLRSTAPYHLINVALNLQGSSDISIRERNSDFFIFSKLFVGGQRTGYCRTDSLEQVFPQMDLATAMAISAAAASPNMGAFTSPAMVAVMTLFNIRLGYWIPNPRKVGIEKTGRTVPFDEVVEEEMKQVQRRWKEVYEPGSVPEPTDRRHDHGVIGVAYSGGGIRSATINLGITQALHDAGVFDHIDYMSTVSGGGYLGSSISTLMRAKTKPFSEIDGVVRVEGHQVIVRDAAPNTYLEPLLDKVTTSGMNSLTPEERRLVDKHVHRFSRDANIIVANQQQVKAGTQLIERPTLRRASLRERFRWRVRPNAFLREMRSKLDENHGWINLSDGGHIENLATIELLRRRCRFIITGDGEADPNMHFGSLATLIRMARIDLGVHIKIDVKNIRLTGKEDRRSAQHFAVGTITYPPRNEEKHETGYLLYLKSSYCGEEDEVVTEYRARKPDFPHESTADQFFDEGQFEAYRALGEHIAQQALVHARFPKPPRLPGYPSFNDREKFEDWFTRMRKAPLPEAAGKDRTGQPARFIDGEPPA